MSSDSGYKYSVIGKSVDILFNVSDAESAHERTVVGLTDGLLVCVAPDGVTEWLPLTSILSIVERNSEREAVRTKSFYGGS